MAFMGLRIDLSMVPMGLQLRNALGQFSDSLQSAREPLEQAVDEVVRPRFRENFESESTAGESWEGLQETTIKRRGGSAHPILHAPVVARKTPGSPHLSYVAQQKQIWEFDGQAGTAMIKELPGTVFYGEYHHTGTGNMPARVFFAITEQDEEKIEEIFSEWIGRKAELTIGSM